MLLDSGLDFFLLYFSFSCMKLFCLHLEIVLLSDANLGTLNISLSILLFFVAIPISSAFSKMILYAGYRYLEYCKLQFIYAVKHH